MIPLEHPLSELTGPVLWTTPGSDMGSLICSACAAKIENYNWAAKIQHEKFHHALKILASRAYVAERSDGP